MTESKHTPGEWQYVDNCIYPSTKLRCIARLDWDIRDEIDDANGRLIVASPKLLKALEDVSSDSNFWRVDWAVREGVIAAIKEAKGE